MTKLQQLAARATDSFGEIILYYLLTIASSGILFSYFEDKPFFESLWWACVTGLTIGYGDLVPKGPLTRVLAICIGVTGVLVVGLVVAVAVRALESASHAR